MSIGAFVDSAGVWRGPAVLVCLAGTPFILDIIADVGVLVAASDRALDIIIALFIFEATAFKGIRSADEVCAGVDGTYIGIVAEIAVGAACSDPANARVGGLIGADRVGFAWVLAGYARVCGAFILIVAIFVGITAVTDRVEVALEVQAAVGGA